MVKFNLFLLTESTSAEETEEILGISSSAIYSRMLLNQGRFDSLDLSFFETAAEIIYRLGELGLFNFKVVVLT